MQTLVSLIIIGLAFGSMLGVVAMGFILIYKASGVLNVAQGSLLMLCAFVCYSLSVQLKLPFFLAAAVTLVFAFILGFVIERLVLRPLINQPVMPVVMATIGLAEVVNGTAMLIWGSIPLNLPQYLPAVYIRFWDVSMAPVSPLSIAVGLLLVLGFALFFRLSREGVAMRAASEDQMAAQSVGVSIGRVFGLTWALSMVTAAVGGIVIATILMVYFNLADVGLRVMGAVIVGGLESVGGAFVGGLLVGVIASLATGYLGSALPAVEEVAPYVVLLLVLLIKPYGLFGQKRIERI